MLVSVGELVWDIFPDRRVLGGAPVNVACHLARLGREVLLVTRVGRDELGREARRILDQRGLDPAGVQEDEELPTGTVQVRFDEQGEPRFVIMAPAAWDAISAGPALAAVGDRDFALVFGTLAQRDPRSRGAIRRLARRAQTSYYDVNLRPPDTTMALVRESLALADVVKMNQEELAQLAAAHGIEADDETAAAAELRRRYALQALAVTRGPDGGFLVTEGEEVAAAGIPVTVADTVGAGDAFFAAVVAGMEAGWPPARILDRANRLGALVASLPGATPEIATLPWEGEEGA